MYEKKQKNLTVIEKKEKPEKVSTSSVNHHSNPIMKKVLDFQRNKNAKFKVKDLFK